jgi:hypothetical protein
MPDPAKPSYTIAQFAAAIEGLQKPTPQSDQLPLPGETGDSADLSWVLNRIAEHAPTCVAAELGWAESEAERIVRANIDRVERLAIALIERREIVGAKEILAIIQGPDRAF